MKKIFLFACIFIQAIGFGQTAFYVSPAGSNTNAGTITKPWKTFQKACDAATPGSTVYLRTGVYAKGDLNKSGTAGNYITFTNYPGEVAVIDGGSVKKTLFYAQNKSYIKIIGLEFKNAIGNNSVGVEFDGRCSHIEFRNNKIHDIHFSADPNAVATATKNVNPFIVYGTDSAIAATDILIQDNEIYNCRTGYSEACTVNGNVDGWQIIGNSVHDISNIGIDAIGGEKASKNPVLDVARNGVIKFNTVYNCKSPYASAGGIYTDGARDVLIERNRSYNNQYGIEVGCENKNVVSTNVTVRNNLIYLNDEAGLALGGYNYPNTGKVTYCTVSNNTLFANDATNSGQGEVTISRLENSLITNNIFDGGSRRLLLTTTINNTLGNVVNYNNWFTRDTNATQFMFRIKALNFKTFTAYKNSTVGWDGASVFGNANFANAGTADFHLTAASAAYNAGNPAYIAGPSETDFDGQPRIYANRIDCGAFESQTTLRLMDNMAVVQVYPNPVNDLLVITFPPLFGSAITTTITDITGKVIYKTTSTATEKLEVNTSDFASGVYFVKVLANDFAETRKVIKN